MLQATHQIDERTEQRTGGRLLVDCLLAHGVDTVFCVPGESYLTVLDALYDVPDKVRIIVGRHEASVANMAEAYGKLTGKPGICFVTRGPGATHASIAVHTAQQDSTPMILFIGQVSRNQVGREAFQELDYAKLFGGTTKMVAEIVDAGRVPEILGRAFHTAVNGRPGPVVISLPEDMQDDLCDAQPTAHYQRAATAPSAKALDTFRQMLASAERPLLIVGGGGWSQQAVDGLKAFAEGATLPVANGFRRQDLFNNTHPHYVGDIGIATNPALIEMLQSADLLIALGERLGDMTSAGYTLLDLPRTKQKLIQINAGAELLGTLYEGDLLINASPEGFLDAVAGLNDTGSADRAAWIAKGRQHYEEFSIPPTENHPKVDVAAIVRELSERLPGNATITNGAGLYTYFVHRYYQYRDYGSQLAPTSGAMGYGVPAAIAAKVVHPDRPAVCFAGDGCFMMAAQELATAVMHKLPIVVIVIDNSCYGSIRGHQERYYPGRVVATDLVSPDFVAFAQSFGAYGERIEATEDFGPALERALATGLPAVLTFRQYIGEVVKLGKPEGAVLEEAVA